MPLCLCGSLSGDDAWYCSGVDFDLSDLQQSFSVRAGELGRTMTGVESPAATIAAAAREGLLDPAVDLLAAAVAVEALAFERAAAGIGFALHTSVLRAVLTASRGTISEQDLEGIVSGKVFGAIAMTSEDVPSEAEGMLNGRASWVVPLTDSGVAVVGARGTPDRRSAAEPAGSGLTAWLLRLDSPGVKATPVPASGLSGVVCGHLELTDVPGLMIGPTQPVMSVVRVLLAAAGLGMGRRAIRESLEAAKGYGRTGAGGEQTVQGLLADSATELDAAKLLTWKAASSSAPSLAEASMAKLAVTEATQHAVARATQIIGSTSFRRGHIIEQLSQDVRALELFAGRTEALREAVALETLPLDRS